MHILDEEQLHHPEQHADNTKREPDRADVTREAHPSLVRRQQAEERRVHDHEQWQKCPDAHEDDLPEEIVADFDLFLVLVRDIVGVIIAFRLEEEVAALTRAHADDPRDQCGHRRIVEQHSVCDDEADGADEMQRLVDAAVMIEAMVVPPLLTQCLHEASHGHDPPVDDPM